MNVQVKLNRKQLNKPRNTNEIKKKKIELCIVLAISYTNMKPKGDQFDIQ